MSINRRPLAGALRVAILLAIALGYCRWRWGYAFTLPPAPTRIARPYAAYVTGVTPTLSPVEKQPLLEVRLPGGFTHGPTFEDALHAIGDATALPIVVNWSALGAVERATPIHVSLAAMKAGDAVSAVLEAADPDTHELGFSVDEGVVTIARREELASPVSTMVYDVRDLIATAPNALAAPLALTSQLQASVAPETWKSNGGAVGAIQTLSGMLIVTQTPENQLLLSDQLARRRWQRNVRQAIRGSLPILSSVALLAISVESGLVLRRRRQARRVGLCPGCGYDLRASIGRCPECGRAMT